MARLCDVHSLHKKLQWLLETEYNEDIAVISIVLVTETVSLLRFSVDSIDFDFLLTT